MPDKDLENQLAGLFSGTDIPQAQSKVISEEPPSPTARVDASAAEEIAVDIAAELETWRTKVLNVLLTVAAVVALPVLYFTVADAFRHPEQWPAAAAFGMTYLVLLGLAFLRRLDSRLRAWGLILIAYVVGGLSMARGGLAGDGFIYLLALPALTLILIGERAGLFTTFLSLLIFAAFALTAHLGWMQSWLIRLDNPLDLKTWLDKGSDLLMVMLVLMGVQWLFNRHLLDTLQEARQTAAELGQTHGLLRQRGEDLEEANRLLEERSRALDASAQVSRTASSLLEPEALIRQTVNLIRDLFDYYYVGLFLLDAEGRWAELKAGSGEAGRQMLAQAHKLEVGSESMIGWCTAHGQARIALDVGEEAIRFDNPLLPETRSEMALPLISQGRVIGALTAQSAEAQAFSDQDVAVLQTMTDQVANAIENAQLLQEIESLAHRRQLISDVTDKLRGSLDLESLLQTTVRELGMALNASEAVIRLGRIGGNGGDGDGGHLADLHHPEPVEGSKEVPS